MEFLSLQEPVESPTLKVGRSGGILLSLGLHLLVVLFFLFGPGVAARLLPESLLAVIGARLRPEPRPPASQIAKQVPPREATKIPLRFEYVRTPDDNLVKSNPSAKILSDKSRRARQEVPTPPQAKAFSSDPHSEGTTIERIRPDPRLAQGKDVPEPPPSDSRSSEDRSAAVEAGNDVRKAGEDGSVSPPAEGPGIRSARPQTPGTPGAGAHSSPPAPEAARDSMRRVLSGQGEESKRLFDNPGHLSPGFASGTMSFDTQDFPWGDYARRLHLIIYNDWIGRVPLSARDGVRGYTCVHFVIQRDGTIRDVEVVLPSSVPPFNRAVLDTLRAISPLPPLPENFPEDQEGMSWCFFYNMLPGEVRELLR